MSSALHALDPESHRSLCGRLVTFACLAARDEDVRCRNCKAVLRRRALRAADEEWNLRQARAFREGSRF